jgi:putative transposase
MRKSRYTEEKIIRILREVDSGKKVDFIRPGKPIENAHIESFMGRFRDECLNENVFVSLDDARKK